MQEIDIYDFDKTIIPFDSGSRFLLYCLVRYPITAIFIPVYIVGGLLTLTGAISFTKFKQTCFCFVRIIPLKKAVKGFWDKHEKQVHKWFFNRKRKSVVISASPDFLLEEIQNRLGFDTLICTRHNSKTGAIIGENCRDEEKVRRLYEEFDENSIRVVDVYSDSLSHDKPIFSLATGNCYHIVKGARRKFAFDKIYKD
jgi:hypothetical protein